MMPSIPTVSASAEGSVTAADSSSITGPLAQTLGPAQNLTPVSQAISSVAPTDDTAPVTVADAPAHHSVAATVRHGSGALRRSPARSRLAGSSTARSASLTADPGSPSVSMPPPYIGVRAGVRSGKRLADDASSATEDTGVMAIPSILARLERLENVIQPNAMTFSELGTRIESLNVHVNEAVAQLQHKIDEERQSWVETGSQLAIRVAGANDQTHDLSERFTDLGVQFKVLEELIHHARSSAPEPQPQTQFYGLNTPPDPQPPGLSGSIAHPGPCVSAEIPRGLFANIGPVTPPMSVSALTQVQRPPTGAHDGMAPSVPFFMQQPTMGGLPFRSSAPPPPPQVAHPPAPDPSQAAQPTSMFGLGKSIQKEISYVISSKDTEHLTVFMGSIRDFESWAKNMVGHLKDGTIRYESLLANVRKSTIAMTKEILVGSEIDGFNAWEISLALGRFTKKYLSSSFTDEDSFYTLCGGDEENGFELWRNLQLQYGGGSKVVEVSGVRNFLQYPRCNNESGLVKHVSAWEKARTKYGHGQTPDTLRILILGILPKALETKLNHKVSKYPTSQSIIRYVNERYEIDRQQVIADALHTKPGRPVHALAAEQPRAEQPMVPSTDASAQPVMPTMLDLANMIAALPGKGERRTAKGEGKGAQGERKVRAKGDRGGQKIKFNFRGCWECGVEGHSRWECDAWKRILDSNGRPPAGHQGAKDKAYVAWKKKRDAEREKSGKGSRSINGLAAHEDTEGESDDDWDEDEEPGTVFALAYKDREPAPVSNRYQALQTTDRDVESEPVIEAMNNFAHRLIMGKKKTQKEQARLRRRSALVIENLADLTSPAAQKIIPALPQNLKALNKLARKCPAEEEQLAEGEVWVMADTGAAVNAIKVSRDCPQYSDHVRPTASSRRGAGAECADGTFIQERGEARVAVEIDGARHVIPFKDMDVSMPIASMRRTIKCGNRLVIEEDGGTITNKTTGHQIKLHERRGTYFFKCKILPPTERTDEADRTSGFMRQG